MSNKEKYKILLELLNHPGEILKEEIDERNMSQAELARRCGLSEKHISSVISGKKDISVSFAKKLEYVLEVDSTFWLNLQMNYDTECYEIKEKVEMMDEELNILKNQYFKVIVSWLEKRGLIEKTSNNISRVFNLREFLNVGNILNVKNLKLEGAFRKQEGVTVDSYTLAAWIKACERITMEEEIENNLDITKLKEQVPEIKSLMFEKDPIEMTKKLKNVFASCGIAFTVIKNFTGAPIHGYIKKKDEKLLLGATLRGKYADKFWFTIFHEIAHIISEDYKDSLVDFCDTDSIKEDKMDILAGDMLIEKSSYKEFIAEGSFSKFSIDRISKENNVLPGITVGRLQKEGEIGFNQFNELRGKYQWKN